MFHRPFREHCSVFNDTVNFVLFTAFIILSFSHYGTQGAVKEGLQAVAHPGLDWTVTYFSSVGWLLQVSSAHNLRQQNAIKVIHGKPKQAIRS